MSDINPTGALVGCTACPRGVTFATDGLCQACKAKLSKGVKRKQPTGGGDR